MHALGTDQRAAYHVPTLVQELVRTRENIVTDLGKVETPGGRRPNIFGLANSAIYFAGINVGRDNMTFLITDLQNNIIKEEYDYTFELQDRPQCFERICSNIENFIATCGIDRGKILGLGVCMTGRVNPDTGAATNISPRANSRCATCSKSASASAYCSKTTPAPAAMRSTRAANRRTETQRALPAHGARRGNRNRCGRTALLREKRVRR